MNSEIIDAGRDMSGGYKVDVSRGTNVDRVSSEWFSRPEDERYLSLDDLFASVKGRAERSRTRTVESAAIRVEAHRDNPEKLGLVLPGADEPIAPTHWSFDRPRLLLPDLGGQQIPDDLLRFMLALDCSGQHLVISGAHAVEPQLSHRVDHV
jgi:hypothetical protein